MTRLYHYLTLLLLLLASLLLSSCQEETPAVIGSGEKITIAAITNQVSTALIHVAACQGYFADEGLDATIQQYTYGKLALDAMLTGKADLAASAETPVMYAIMTGNPLVVLATIQSSKENEAILAVKAQGIQTLGDLKGKRIAVTPGTSGEFFLETMLTSAGLDQTDVTIVPLSPAEMPEALRTDQVDAVAVWNFPLLEMSNELGDRGVVLRDQTLYTSFFCLSSLQQFALAQPERLKKVMRALVRAEDFIKSNPDAVKQQLATAAAVDIKLLTQVWDSYSLAATMNQALLIVLEDEARWAISRKLVAAAEIHNFADHLFPDALAAVKPAAVRLIR